MEKLLALDNIGNEINRILFKGDSDWYSSNAEGYEVVDHLIPCIDTIEEKAIERKAKGYNVYGQSYNEILEQDVANVFHLNMNELSNEEHERLMDYVYGYVEAVV